MNPDDVSSRSTSPPSIEYFEKAPIEEQKLETHPNQIASNKNMLVVNLKISDSINEILLIHKGKNIDG